MSLAGGTAELRPVLGMDRQTGEDEQQGKGDSMQHDKRYCTWSG